MEDLNMYQQNQYKQYNTFDQNSTGLSISQSELRCLAGWAKFIAIVQIIGAAIMCLGIFAIFFNPVFIVYPGMAVVFILMGVKLLNAASSIRRFIDSGDYYSLSNSLRYFKSYFKINGIMVIIGMALAVLGIILAVLAIGAFGSILNQYKLRY